MKPLRRLRLRSLQAKLAIAFVAIALLPLLLLTGLTQHLTQQFLTAAAYQGLEATSLQTAQSLDSFLTANLDSIRSAALQPDIVDYLQRSAEQRQDREAETRIQQTLQALLRRSGLNIIAYMLLDPQGRGIIDSKLDVVHQDFSQESYFREAIATELPYVSPVQFIQLPQEIPVLHFSNIVRDEQDHVLGVLVARYNASAIQQLVRQSKQLAGEESFAILLDEQYIPLAYGDAPKLAFRPLVPIPPDKLKALQLRRRLPSRPLAAPFTNWTELQPILGNIRCQTTKTCSAGYAIAHLAIDDPAAPDPTDPTLSTALGEQFAIAITPLQKQPWYVMYVTPNRLLLAPVRAQLQMSLLLAGAIAVGVAFLALWVGQQFALPIVDLTQQVVRFTHGSLEARVRCRTQDEIGILATNFNQMAEQVGNLLQERTQQLKAVQETEAQYRQKAEELEQALYELRQTQAHLVQSEKMSSLGQMVAGVAHEINNPASFIHGNLTHVQHYTHDVLRLISLYQAECPHASPQLQSALSDIDLDFIQKDLPKVLTSMKTGTNRIREIVLSLRNFSRLDEAEFKRVDIHEGLDSTLVILSNRLNAVRMDRDGKDCYRPNIQIIKCYGQFPAIKCYPGELNQVFLNILNNAVDAIEDRYGMGKHNVRENVNDWDGSQADLTLCETTGPFTPTISINTYRAEPGWLRIEIGNNGLPIPDSIRDRLFDPFFTTKPIGKGTGMGLAICYQTITEKHKGKLFCTSTEQETRFILELPIPIDDG